VKMSTSDCCPNCFYQYLTVEEDFIKNLFRRGTQIGPGVRTRARADQRPGLHVLDYERASSVIDRPRHGGRTLLLRHKKSHLGQACDAPLDICMTLAAPHESLIKHGFARRVDAREGFDLLQQARERKLVQFARMSGTCRVHLQLLRLLLRGHDCRATFRQPPSDTHDQLHPGD